MELRTALMRVDLPSIDKIFSFQASNFLLILSIMKLQSDLLGLEWCNRTPKYLFGNCVVERPSRLANDCVHFSDSPKPIKELLS